MRTRVSITVSLTRIHNRESTSTKIRLLNQVFTKLQKKLKQIQFQLKRLTTYLSRIKQMRLTIKWKKFKSMTTTIQSTMSRSKSQSVIWKTRIIKWIRRLKSVVQTTSLMIQFQIGWNNLNQLHKKTRTYQTRTSITKKI